MEICKECARMRKAADKDRIELVGELMDHMRNVTMVHDKILNMRREYFPGEWYYLRETHFINAIGLGRICTMTELAEKLEVTPGAVSHVAGKLEKAGCVERSISREDRRIIEIRLTEKGEELYRRHKAFDEERHANVSAMLSKYSDEDLKKFIEFAQTMTGIFGGFVENRKTIDK